MISFDDFQDKYIGKIGTPKRDAFEKKVEKAVHAYKAVDRTPLGESAH